jgi:hypothetical protein
MRPTLLNLVSPKERTPAAANYTPKYTTNLDTTFESPRAGSSFGRQRRFM